MYPESDSWTSATKSLIAATSLLKVIEILDDYDVETDSPIWSINKAMLGMLINKNYIANNFDGANEANINSFELLAEHSLKNL